ncbi:CRISPR-associated protein [Corynebacterium hadale]|uniref:CRISPR-associated protein n=1 Tax=Corynebacterium hadale TaxID=2026255 RepID=A0ABX4H9W6_9CORY|nr:CRISPR-associated protein [Corynebacterium hadale]
MAVTPVPYRVGIDVGTHSVGFAAIQMDENNLPLKILSAVSLIHDSGVDPDENKAAISRLAKSGVARRTRRLYKRRRARLRRLEAFLTALGWRTVPFENYSDPYHPWKVRAELVNGYIADEQERGEKLSVAVRHIANHRGWRNPYKGVSSLYNPGDASDNFEQIRAELSKKKGIAIPKDCTVGQLISFASFGVDRLRGGGKKKDAKKPADEVKNAVLSARLHQRDLAREVNEICRVQRIDDDLRKDLLDHIFVAESPKGAQAGRVGKDPLQPTRNRALKASDAFQRYRIASIIGNLRIKDAGPLSSDQFALVFEFLVNADPKKDVSWNDIADLLGIDRGDLRGTAAITEDFERAGNRPPIHETAKIFSTTKIKPLKEWWSLASPAARSAMVGAMSNGAMEQVTAEPMAEVESFFASLSEDEQAKLDDVHLPMGRAAYSEDTLERLTARMIKEGTDLFNARKAEFGVANDWRPPALPIGERVGNPAVDRVLKAVARFLAAAEKQWGAPAAVVVEHVRDGFISEAKTRELERDNERRRKRNEKLVEEMHRTLGIQGKVRSGDIWRYQSVQRQNCKCAYCGETITYHTAEMDHIVPQAGPGSTNTRDNLVAVCHRCNLAKKNVPFATWAGRCGIPGVSLQNAIEQTRFWSEDEGLTRPQFNKFRNSVRARLRRTSLDEPLDNRSLESVAWMANELHARIAQHFQAYGTKVNVYRGELTHEARLASGIHDRIRFVDGTGKSRLDRRHHAVDAAVVSMTTPYVAETLSLRRNQQRNHRLTGQAGQWREICGIDVEHRAAWSAWKRRMDILAELLAAAMKNDELVVTSNRRLRPGNSRAHEDTIGELETRKVGDALPAEVIDKASTEALWCALTRHPDFDPKNGLPENPQRKIRVHGTHLNANSEIGFFPIKSGAVAVRGGYAELSRFHHARVYKIHSGKKPTYAMLRVYDYDLRNKKDVDVFSVGIPPQTMSMRQAEPKLRRSLAEGSAEYLGWIAPNDEFVIDPLLIQGPDTEALFEAYGHIDRWVLKGFYGRSKLTLFPLMLSAEGLQPDEDPRVAKLLKNKGLIKSVNPLFSAGEIQVIRRTTLGRERWKSSAHLPVSWKSR